MGQLSSQLLHGAGNLASAAQSVFGVGIVSFYNEHVGPYLLIALLLPTGLILSILLKAIQVRRLGHAFGLVSGRYDDPKDVGDVSHFQALSAALSATVGIGNIAGVALAIALGGPGAVFWMWITGILGMALKYAECTLAVKYRDVNPDGSVSGGPMYYIRKGLGPRLGAAAPVLAGVFALSAIFCSFATGNMAQSNSMADAMKAVYGVPTWASGIAVAALVFVVIVGGIKRIGRVASILVPFMAALYVGAGLLVIFGNLERVPGAFQYIFEDAFTGRAAGGGFFATMIWGIRRGLFSNEAGQGSAPIAHAAAKTEYPVREGLVALTEPLIDTLIICTITALVVVMCGDFQALKGAELTTQAYGSGLASMGISSEAGRHIVTWSACLFAFSTAVSWSYYGDRSVQYFTRSAVAVIAYRVVFCGFLFLGAIFKLEVVWNIADMVITFMAVPNLLALLLLLPEILRDTRAYFAIEHLPTKHKAKLSKGG
ncbi:MAG: sodium:alanine symporter family protein [Polyangia bacterium]|jgi:AGCS family alanine or glycine:cation symporter|nr:sodium:alanine symporter family protein [Polyangia bacterium]